MDPYHRLFDIDVEEIIYFYLHQLNSRGYLYDIKMSTIVCQWLLARPSGYLRTDAGAKTMYVHNRHVKALTRNCGVMTTYFKIWEYKTKEERDRDYKDVDEYYLERDGGGSGFRIPHGIHWKTKSCGRACCIGIPCDTRIEITMVEYQPQSIQKFIWEYDNILKPQLYRIDYFNEVREEAQIYKFKEVINSINSICKIYEDDNIHYTYMELAPKSEYRYNTVCYPLRKRKDRTYTIHDNVKRLK